MDFRHGRIIGDVLEVLPTGVDHVFVVDMNAFETDGSPCYFMQVCHVVTLVGVPGVPVSPLSPPFPSKRSSSFFPHFSRAETVTPTPAKKRDFLSGTIAANGMWVCDRPMPSPPPLPTSPFPSNL